MLAYSHYPKPHWYYYPRSRSLAPYCYLDTSLVSYYCLQTRRQHYTTTLDTLLALYCHYTTPTLAPYCYCLISCQHRTTTPTPSLAPYYRCITFCLHYTATQTRLSRLDRQTRHPRPRLDPDTRHQTLLLLVGSSSRSSRPRLLALYYYQTSSSRLYYTATSRPVTSIIILP